MVIKGFFREILSGGRATQVKAENKDSSKPISHLLLSRDIESNVQARICDPKQGHRYLY